LPPDFASSARASATFAPVASKRMTWWTSAAFCGLTTADVTNAFSVSFGSRRKQW
jgi:hypothetical protein